MRSSKRKEAKVARRKARNARGKVKREGGMRAHQVERLNRLRGTPTTMGIPGMSPSMLHMAGLEHNEDACSHCAEDRA